MTRLTIFAKGNVDLRDSLVAHRDGQDVVWNGLNEVLRARHPQVTARVRHETWTRSDALLAAAGAVPAGLAERGLELGAYTPESQFSRTLFDGRSDAVVLSVQPDVSTSLARHKAQDYLFFPNGFEGWAAADQAWFRQGFSPLALLEPEQSMHNLSRVIEQLRAKSSAPILIYNLSPVVPGERVSCYRGLSETYATRIRRFNLALVELSRGTGVSIVDVDAIVARAGADRLKVDAVHLSPHGSRLVAEEVVRVLEDLGCLVS